MNLDPITLLPDPEVPQDRGWLDALSAGMALQNPISALVEGNYVSAIEDPGQEGYDPFIDPQIKGYDPDLFKYSNSEIKTANIIDRIESDAKLRARAESAWGTAGQVFGALGNPILMAPAIATGGSSLPAMIGGIAGGEVLNEAVLHSMQPGRTMGETYINVGTATLLGGLFGSMALRGRVPGRVEGEVTFNKTGVAAAVEDVLKLGPERAAGEMATMGPLGKMVFGFSPAGDVLANSYSKSAKEVVQNLVETSYRFEPGKVVPQAVETAVKAAHGDMAAMTQYFDDVYRVYKKGGGTLTQDQFLEEVAVAMRNGDVHEVPDIVKVARNFRQFDEGYKQEAISLGLLDPEARLKGAKSHLQRIYHRRAINENYKGLRELLRGKILKAMRKGNNYHLVKFLDEETGHTEMAYVHAKDLKNYDAAYKDVTVITGEEMLAMEPMMMAEAADGVAISIVNRLLASKPVDVATLDYIVPKAGSLHERTLKMVSDEELKPYLNNNALQVMGIHAQSMRRELELTRTFGDARMSKFVGEEGVIAKEYNELIANAKSGRERAKIVARRNKDLHQIQAMRDLILGTYGAPKDPTSAFVTMGRGMRIGAMLSAGANITTSSFSDMLAPVFRNGFESYMDGIKVLFSGIRPEYVKYVQRIGIGVEAITHSRTVAFTEMAFAGEYTNRAMQIYGKYSGLNWFTDVSMSLNAVSTSETWVRWLRNYGKLSTKKRQKLLDVGIDEEWSARIVDQIRQHGTPKNGVTIPETHLWEDVAAARRYENALRKEVNSTTIIPGKGDVNLNLKSEAGKFFGMFMSWMQSATQRWIMAGLQRHDIEFLQGIFATSVAGGMVQYAKDMVKGKDLSEDDAMDYIIKAMDRGGSLGVFSIPVNAVRNIAEHNNARRYGQHTFSDLFMPAGARYGQEIAGTLAKIGSGEDWSEEDTWRFVRAVPMLNVWHTMDLLQRASE